MIARTFRPVLSMAAGVQKGQGGCFWWPGPGQECNTRTHQPVCSSSQGKSALQMNCSCSPSSRSTFLLQPANPLAFWAPRVAIYSLLRRYFWANAFISFVSAVIQRDYFFLLFCLVSFGSKHGPLPYWF